MLIVARSIVVTVVGLMCAIPVPQQHNTAQEPAKIGQFPAHGSIPADWSQQHSGRMGTLLRPSPDRYVFSVRRGDVWSREKPNNPTERSEISQRSRWQIGHEFWFAFDMLITAGLPIDARWVVVGQLHQTSNVGDGRGSPPWAQMIYPGRRFTIQIRHSQENPLRHNPQPVILFTDPYLKEGHRYSFVYRLSYDPKGGALDTWRDGRKIVTYRGPLGYPGKIGPYLKFGIYRAKAEGELEVVFSNIRYGMTLCEVVHLTRQLPNLPDHALNCSPQQ